MPEATLDEIGMKHGTDKSSPGHGYLAFYELFFGALRNRAITILEIGVLDGASLKTWEEYFPNARVVGVDISLSSKKYEIGRIVVELVDQSNIEELTRVGVRHGPFDIVIDDGSHMWEHQITSLRTLFPFVNNDGLYIVEDLHTNFGELQKQFKGIASTSCMDFLKAWSDIRVADNQTPTDEIEDAFLRTYGRAAYFLTFFRRACLIKKRLPPISRAAHPGQPLAVEAIPGSPLGVRLLVHIGNYGDVTAHTGFINIGSGEFPIEGITIDPIDPVLEYRVRLSDGSWSDWAPYPIFMGSRGESKPLTGIACRLVGDAGDKYVLLTFARFVGADATIEALDGEDCASTSGQAMCGVQIVIAARAPIA